MMKTTSFLPALSLCLVIFLPHVVYCGGGGVVLKVQRKLDASLSHSRFLSGMSIDFPLGGSEKLGSYFTEIEIGTPPRNYTMNIDTGSDTVWVNCEPCTGCMKNESQRPLLTIYDPNASETSRRVSCSDDLCRQLIEKKGVIDDAQRYCQEKFANESKYKSVQDMPCPFKQSYGSGEKFYGDYVTDRLTYRRVSGDHVTEAVRADFAFGCASLQNRPEGKVQKDIQMGYDGLIGFTQSNKSFLYQLASTGRVRRVFSHCLDSKRGGGIFAVGRVVEPKVRTTPIAPNLPMHYHVNLRSIQVGGETLQVRANAFANAQWQGTIVDTGSTHTVLPAEIWEPFTKLFNSKAGNTQIQLDDRFMHLVNPVSPEKVLPIITLNFDGDLSLEVAPRDYLGPRLFGDNGVPVYTLGISKGVAGDNLLVVGDTSLVNKLVVYDLENQTIGWTNHDCSSGIVIEGEEEEEEAGKTAAYKVDSHNEEAQREPSKQTCPSPSS